MFSNRIVTVLCAIALPIILADKKVVNILKLEQEKLPLENYQHKSYYFGEIFKATYFQAEQFCRSNNMHLLSITTEEENNFLLKKIIERGLTGDRLWTSGTRLPDGEHWVWMSTGRRFVYTNWPPGEPNDAQDYDEQCMEVKSDKDVLIWNDVNCWRQLNFICEISWPEDCYNLLQKMNVTKAANPLDLINIRMSR